MMIWNTPAIAIPCSLATSGGTALVSLMAAGQGGGLAVGQLQRQPMDGRTDGRQVAELAMPELRRDAADPGDGFKDEARGWQPPE